MNRHDTLFSIRYAVRVLERHAALWRWLHRLCRICSLLAGSAAIAALSAQMTGLAIAAGVVFAAVQAVEFGVKPDEIAAASRAQRRCYADVLAAQATLDDAALLAAYRAAVAGDEVVVGGVLKELAYNDVTAEMGCDDSASFSLHWPHRLVRWLA